MPRACDTGTRRPLRAGPARRRAGTLCPPNALPARHDDPHAPGACRADVHCTPRRAASHARSRTPTVRPRRSADTLATRARPASQAPRGAGLAERSSRRTCSPAGQAVVSAPGADAPPAQGRPLASALHQHAIQHTSTRDQPGRACRLDERPRCAPHPRASAPGPATPPSASPARAFGPVYGRVAMSRQGDGHGASAPSA